MKKRAAAAILGLALTATACDKPPTREIEAAQAQVDAARQQGAETYAPDRMKEAQQALQTARERVEDGEYRAAVAAAAQAGERARSAVQAVAAARTLARGRAQVAVAEVKAVLDEVDAIVQEAVAAQVPEDAFAEVAPQLQELRESLDGLEAAIEKDALRAETAAGQLKARAADLTTSYRQAQAKWMAEHRQSKGRKGLASARRRN